MIRFTIHKYTKPLIILTRTVSQVTNVNKNTTHMKFNELNLEQTTNSQHKERKKYDFNRIINCIESPSYISSKQLLSMFQWNNDRTDCTPQDKVKLMELLWLNLTICNFQFNLQHYNALLELYIDNNYDFSVSDFLTKMKNNQIYPDEFTYYMCIKYYCMKGNIDEAMLFMKCNINTHTQYSVEIFNSLLFGYSQLGNIKSIDNILNIMNNRKIKRTADTNANVICTYAKLNDINKVKELIQVCNVHNMYFTNTHILRVIYTLAANNHVEYIDNMYQYLKKTLKISNKEIQIILDILSICEVHIALTTLSHMILENNCPHHKNIIKIALKYAVDINMAPDKMIEICNYYKYSEEVYKELLLVSLYYTLLKDNHLSLALLRECKSHFKIKPHYFWPLFVRNALKFDFDGILNILDIMINEFNITPCIHTLSDYILPVSVGSTEHIRNLLMTYKINETIVNNAYVLLILKSCDVNKAAEYVTKYPDKYFYNILSQDLRRASVQQKNVENFIHISCRLLESTENIGYSENILNNDEHNLVLASIDKQLCDTMLDYPHNKLWFKKVIKRLVIMGTNLQPKTITRISNFLHGYNVMSILGILSNKKQNMQIN